MYLRPIVDSAPAMGATPGPDDGSDAAVLYQLLCERTPGQSISHKAMPSYADHCAFVSSRPYLAWYIIVGDVIAGRPDLAQFVGTAGFTGRGRLGAIYLSKQREIGVSIFRQHQRKGYARAAVLELMRLHPGRFLANVNPANEASRKLWESLGGKLIQVTYELPVHRS